MNHGPADPALGLRRLLADDGSLLGAPTAALPEGRPLELLRQMRRVDAA